MIEVVAASALVAGLLAVGVGAERRLARVECAGHEVLVRERGPFRELVWRRGGQEMIHGRVLRRQPLRSGFPYTDGFHLLPLLAPDAARGLFLGAGAGVGPRQFRAAHGRIALDVVELHGSILGLAREYFGLHDGPGLRLLEADADAFLGEVEARYDVVVVDVCEVFTVPPALCSPVFFEKLRARLAPGGCFVMNTPGALAGPQARAPRALARAARRVFPELVVLPVPGTTERGVDALSLRNVLLLGGRGPLSPPEQASFPSWLPWAPGLLGLLRGEIEGAG